MRHAAISIQLFSPGRVIRKMRGENHNICKNYDTCRNNIAWAPPKTNELGGGHYQLPPTQKGKGYNK